MSEAIEEGTIRDIHYIRRGDFVLLLKPTRRGIKWAITLWRHPYLRYDFRKDDFSDVNWWSPDEPVILEFLGHRPKKEPLPPIFPAA